MKFILINIIVALFTLNCFSQNNTDDIKKIIPPEDGVYFGAFTCGSTEDSVTIDRLNEIKNIAGFTPAWIYFSNNWFEKIKFPSAEVKIINDFGSVPFIRLMPRTNFNEKKPDPVYTLQKFIKGDFDRELKKWADDARDSDIPLMVEFGTEVNGNWFPWSGAQNGKDPKRFIDAYRHIIELFKNESANNITWVFHIDANSEPDAEWNKMSLYYPGDDYIDWIGVSIYGAQNPNDETDNFIETFDNTYKEMCLITSNKPMAIVEFGTVENSVKEIKPAWIRSVFESVKENRYPGVKALSYWHSIWENDDGSISNMRLDSSPEVLKMAKEILSDDFFRQKINLK